MTLQERLRQGCIEHRRRWSGDTHDDLGGSVDTTATDALMTEAAAELDRLETLVARLLADSEPRGRATFTAPECAFTGKQEGTER